MEDRAVTWANDKERRKDMRRRKIADIRGKIQSWRHMVLWRFMHFAHIATPYSRIMCRLNLYRKFPEGRCMWCGIKH